MADVPRGWTLEQVGDQWAIVKSNGNVWEYFDNEDEAREAYTATGRSSIQARVQRARVRQARWNKNERTDLRRR